MVGKSKKGRRRNRDRLGKKDTAIIRYFEDEERYADLINGYRFGGKQIIRPEDVHEKDTRVTGIRGRINRVKKNLFVQKYRDSVRKVVCGMGTMMIGLEHQDMIHYGMPVRIMVEDALEYDSQMRKIQKRHRRNSDLKTKEEYVGAFGAGDRILPAATIVLYYGKEPWNGARNLSELMDMEALPEEMQSLVNDYPLHILGVQRFKEIDRFKTDIKEVFGFVQRMNDKEQLREFTEANKEHFEHLDEDAYDVISVMANSMELWEKKEQYRKEGGMDMCLAIQEMIEDGKREGIQQGLASKSETVAKNMFSRGMSVEDAAAICEESLKQVQIWYDAWKKGR